MSGQQTCRFAYIRSVLGTNNINNNNNEHVRRASIDMMPYRSGTYCDTEKDELNQREYFIVAHIQPRSLSLIASNNVISISLT